MVMGSGFPDEYMSALCMRNAASSKSEESLALASNRTVLAFPKASSQMRLLFGSRRSAARQDVPAAADMDTVSEEADFEPWAAYRKAKKGTKKGEREWGSRETREEQTSQGWAHHARIQSENWGA